MESYTHMTKQISNLEFDRENLKHKKEFKTCEGDSIFLVSGWLQIFEKKVDKRSPLFIYGETFEDGESDLQDSVRLLRYFLFEGRICPLTEFGIFGTDYDVQIISFIVPIKVGGKTKKKIHFINGYCMSDYMEWMLIEIDKNKNRLKVYECNPKCVW